MDTSNDEILHAIKCTPERGFRILMRKYGDAIYWHIRHLVVSHNDTQDIMQETFIKVFRSIDTLNDSNALTPWIYRIATRQALSALRKKKHPADLLDEAIARGIEPTADRYIDYSDLESIRLQKAILSLPEKQRLTFNMRYYSEMEYAQIAEALGTSPSTAKVNYHLAKEKVMKYLSSND